MKQEINTGKAYTKNFLYGAIIPLFPTSYRLFIEEQKKSRKSIERLIEEAPLEEREEIRDKTVLTGPNNRFAYILGGLTTTFTTTAAYTSPLGDHLPSIGTAILGGIAVSSLIELSRELFLTQESREPKRNNEDVLNS